MTTVQQGLFRGQRCSPCGEDVVHQPELHLGCMDIGPECAAEVRQPLLTVEVVLAGANPGALQKIGADPAESCGNQAWEGLARRRFQLGMGTSTAVVSTGSVARRQPISAESRLSLGRCLSCSSRLRNAPS